MCCNYRDFYKSTTFAFIKKMNNQWYTSWTGLFPHLKEFHMANISAINKMDHIEFWHLGNIVFNSDFVWVLSINRVNTQPVLLLWFVRTHLRLSSTKVWTRVFFCFFFAKDVGTTVWDFLFLGQSESCFIPAADLSTCWVSMTSTWSFYSATLKRSSWPGSLVSLLFPVLFSTVHTDIKPQPQRGSVLFTDLNKTGMTKAVFARMRKAQAKLLICIANNKKMVNSLLKYYDSLNVLNNHQKKKKKRKICVSDR